MSAHDPSDACPKCGTQGLTPDGTGGVATGVPANAGIDWESTQCPSCKSQLFRRPGQPWELSS